MEKKHIIHLTLNFSIITSFTEMDAVLKITDQHEQTY